MTVTVYTTPQCPFCIQLKDFLQILKVPFIEYNVIDEPDKLNEMKRLSGGSLSVPIIVFNKDLTGQKVLIGFQPDMVERMLGIYSEVISTPYSS